MNINRSTHYDRQKVGLKPDKTFKFGSMELGYVEAGLRDCGEKATKELKERTLKLPKMMKDTAVAILKEYPEMKDSVRIVGFIISGNTVEIYILMIKLLIN
jgi:hypothetical protein